MRIIEVGEIRAAIVQAINERGGDYTYRDNHDFSACTYGEADGSPSCLIGCAINYLDPELFAALLIEEAAVNDDTGDGLSVLGIKKAFGMSPIARRAMTQAQAVQDGGGTWHSALEAFDNTEIYEKKVEAAKL